MSTMQAVWGKLLDGNPAQIHLTAEESRAFDQAKSYQGKLLLLRRAAFKQRMISFLLTEDGILVSNLNCIEPGPNEELIWLRSGQFGEVLDRSPTIILGPAAVELLSVRGSHPKPIAPDDELLDWLDPKVGVTAKDLAACMGIERSSVQRRLTAMYALGLVRRNGPSDRHNPVRWFLAEDPGGVMGPCASPGASLRV